MATPGAILLSYVPQSNQRALFSGLIESLQPDDISSIDFVASVVVDQEDEEPRNLLIAFLQRSVEADKPDAAVAIASKYPEIGGNLFTRSVESLEQAKPEHPSAADNAAFIASHLRFCKSTYSLFPFEQPHKALFSLSLAFLARADVGVRSPARDFVFAALANRDAAFQNNIVQPHHSELWSQIQTLVAAVDNKPAQVLGYSLWLRWIVPTKEFSIEHDVSEDHWNQILRGLRQGDTEIRKLCLNILRLSLASRSSNINLEARAQFERYATIFETIVLGRYINQIQECEGDLNDLVSERTLVESKWLYTLLASALDSQMQDSNRKFIGNWVMRAYVRSGTELPGFLQDDFLPWATQGSSFVASLTRNDKVSARCLHGERLACYLTILLRNERQAEEIPSIVWSYVASKKTFPYAKVWLLKALSESYTNTSSDDGQSRLPWHAGIDGGALSEQILNGLPEVARDYIAQRLVDLGISVSSETGSSRRDILEQEAIEKCDNVDSAEQLDDLWGDLDYLEFPKNLLFHVPRAVLRPKLVDQALDDPDLASSLRDKVMKLQKVAETKSYLVSPLNTALRAAVVRNVNVFCALSMANYIVRAVDIPPEPTIDLMLEESTVHLFAKYENYFGERPTSGVVALLDLVSRTDDQQQLETLLDRLLQRWRSQKIPPPTVSPWKTTLQLQTLLICLENLHPSQDQAHALIKNLLHILSIEPLPRYRYLLEWAITRLLQRMKLEHLVLEELASKDHHSNPKYLASLMKIGSIIACSPASSEEFANNLATLYVPLAASSKVVIRHEAQWQVPVLFDHARSKQWSGIAENPALVALDDYIRSLERFHKPPPERKIGRYDPERHHTLANLVEGPWFGLDSTESPLTSREDFVKLYAQSLPDGAPESCMPLGDPVDERVRSPLEIDNATATKAAPAPRTVDDVVALQTKGTAYLARTLSDPTTSATRPNNLIIVGSLVDNPYNLGGLSRVSEIFGASALTLQNQNVVGNKDFTSVSVSSHLHFPIVQLSAAGVPAFLGERKAEGFTIVGIEQTDRSVILGSDAAKLPERCVLVVGSEKEGIPAVVLTECDVLVEIPQKGVTRSLNVQTAVSVVLFEYARQHMAMK